MDGGKDKSRKNCINNYAAIHSHILDIYDSSLRGSEEQPAPIFRGATKAIH